MLLYTTYTFGQNTDSEDIKRIKIQVATPSGIESQPNVADLLKKRLIQSVALNGIGSTSSRFLLVCQIQELNSYVTQSTPPQYVSELEIYCFLADQIEKTILQQMSFQVKGVDRSKEKAVMNAISSIQARNPQLKKFINKGKEKILAYYHTACTELMKQIESNIRRERYEEAILQLISIPDIDSECKNHSLYLLEQIDELKRKQIIMTLEDDPNTEWIEEKIEFK